MTTELWIAVAVIAALLLIIAFMLVRLSKRSGQPDALEGFAKELFNQFDTKFKENREELSKQLGDNRKELDSRLKNSQDTQNKQLGAQQKAMQELVKKLTKIEESEKTISQLDQSVGGLRQILESPHKRGQWGERKLQDIVESYLHRDLYALQYDLKSNQEGATVRCDCYIKLDNPPGPVCIDAKFPAELYENVVKAQERDEQNRAGKELAKAVKALINDIAKKYIIPNQTADFAIMFVPSEAIMGYLYEHFGEVFEESDKKRVYLTSPHTLIPTFHAIRSATASLEIARQATEIRGILEKVAEDAKRLLKRGTALEGSLNTSVKHVQNFNVSAEKISKVTTGLKTGKLADKSDGYNGITLENDDQSD